VGWRLETESESPLSQLDWSLVSDSLSDDAYFQIYSLTEYEMAGVEVFNHYDDLPNYRLMINFGFAIEGNKKDSTVLRFQLPPNEPQKKQILVQNGVAEEHRLTSGVKLPLELFDLIRVILSPTVRELGTKRPFFVDTKTDQRVLAQLSNTIVGLLRKFQSTVEEDELNLKKPQVKGMLRAILIVRMGEKLLLIQALQELDAMQKAFESGEIKQIEGFTAPPRAGEL